MQAGSQKETTSYSTVLYTTTNLWIAKHSQDWNPPQTNSFINWFPDIQFGKELSRILTPSMGKSKSFVKNSGEFVRARDQRNTDI